MNAIICYISVGWVIALDNGCPNDRLAERELVDAVLNEDRAAMLLLYTCYKKIIYNLINGFRFIGRDERDDCYHSIIVHLMDDGWRRLGLWRGSSRLSTYIYKVSRNFILDKYNKPALTDGMDDPDKFPNPGPEGGHDRDLSIDVKRSFESAISSLSERDGKIVTLIFVEEKSPEDVSVVKINGSSEPVL